MIIQHNIPALNSHRQLGINNNNTAKNLEKLSSGYRVNRAGDDAAGLAISEKMRGQIRGLEMATQNASNGVSLIQTAEGGLNETHAILQRMRELAVQSANGTYDDEVDRLNLDTEVQALKSEIDRISTYTAYNGIKLLDGTLGGTKTASAGAVATALGIGTAFGIAGTAALSGQDATIILQGASGVALQVNGETITGGTSDNIVYSFTLADNSVVKLTFGAALTTATKAAAVAGITLGATSAAAKYTNAMVGTTTSQLTFQIGANGTADQQVGLHVNNMATGFLGDGKNFVNEVSVAKQSAANAAIAVIDAATNQVSTQRAGLGALQNRLEHTINNLGVTQENLQAAESSIRDVDMAKEMMAFTKNNILSQAAQSMLAQANTLPQGILQLLR